MEFQFEYKCRRCGSIEKSPGCGGKDRLDFPFTQLMAVVSNTPSQLHMMSTHCCADGGVGVTDLQGFGVVKA